MTNIKNKEVCDCGEMATWLYMPSYEGGGNPYHCDDCVPRGCECNNHYVDVNTYHPPLDFPDLPTKNDNPIKWIKEEEIWCSVDELGREYPCCEFTYDKEGFEIDDELN